jgi:hypothetical protein
VSAQEHIDRLFEATLLEMGLSRALDHYKGREFAQLSADVDSREVPGARQRMEAALKGLGLGFITTKGRGQEQAPDGSSRASEELSYFVPNRTRASDADHDVKLPDFLDKMLDLAASFNQQYIAYGPGDGTAQLVSVPRRAVEQRWSSWHAGVAPFHTALRGHRAFYYESFGRALPNRVSVFEGMAWQSRGEIIVPGNWPYV